MEEGRKGGRKGGRASRNKQNDVFIVSQRFSSRPGANLQTISLTTPIFKTGLPNKQKDRPPSTPKSSALSNIGQYCFLFVSRVSLISFSNEKEIISQMREYTSIQAQSLPPKKPQKQNRKLFECFLPLFLRQSYGAPKRTEQQFLCHFYYSFLWQIIPANHFIISYAWIL